MGTEESVMGISTRYVGPRGSDRPKLYLVGEAPGRKEDEQGEVFVGPSGELLWWLVKEAGWLDDEWRVWNMLAHRPFIELSNRSTHDRKPTPEEIVVHRPRLFADIHRTMPQVIVLLGGSAAAGWGIPGAVGSIRGKVYRRAEFPRTPVGVTYHPSYLLRGGGKSHPDTERVIKDLRMYRNAKLED